MLPYKYALHTNLKRCYLVPDIQHEGSDHEKVLPAPRHFGRTRQVRSGKVRPTQPSQNILSYRLWQVTCSTVWSHCLCSHNYRCMRIWEPPPPCSLGPIPICSLCNSVYSYHLIIFCDVALKRMCTECVQSACAWWTMTLRQTTWHKLIMLSCPGRIHRKFCSFDSQDAESCENRECYMWWQLIQCLPEMTRLTVS